MLSLKTQKVLAMLHDISICSHYYTEKMKVNKEEMEAYLLELERAGLICLLAGMPERQIDSYSLNNPLSKISLLTLLEAIDDSWIAINRWTRFFIIATVLCRINWAWCIR